MAGNGGWFDVLRRVIGWKSSAPTTPPVVIDRGVFARPFGTTRTYFQRLGDKEFVRVFARLATHQGRKFTRQDGGGGESVGARSFTRGAIPSLTITRDQASCSRVFTRVDPMSSVTIPAATLPKAVNESVSYVFDFSNFPEMKAGETISSPVVPAVVGVTIGTPTVTTVERDFVLAGKGVAVTVSGGTAGVSYLIACRATFSGGSVREVRGIVAVV